MAFTYNNQSVNNPNLYIDGMNFVWVSASTFAIRNGACRAINNASDIIVSTGTHDILGESYTLVDIRKTGLNGSLKVPDSPNIYYVYALGSTTDTQSVPMATKYVVPGTNNNQPTTIKSPSLAPAGYLVVSADFGETKPPVPYDIYRLVGHIRINSSLEVEPFDQRGSDLCRTMTYRTPYLLIDGVPPSNNYPASVLEEFEPDRPLDWTGLVPYTAISVLAHAVYDQDTVDRPGLWAFQTIGNADSVTYPSQVIASLGGGSVASYGATVEVPVKVVNSSGLYVITYSVCLGESTGSGLFSLAVVGYVDDLSKV